MSLFKADNLESLKEFKDTDYKLGILEREHPEGAGSFFQKLMKNDFGIEGTLSSINLKEDLKNLVQEIIPNQLSSTEFYNYWLADMETVCRTFLLIEKTDTLPQSRKQFAEWITSEANPRFTTVIVNRLWKRAFGIGLIEPVDDMNDNTESSNPKLLAYLEKIMASVDYDVKEFMRVLYSMDLFTRDSVKDDHKGVETFYFAGPPLQRMKGEQIWDSLVTLVYNDIDSPDRFPSNYDEKYQAVYDRYKEYTAQEIYDELKEYLANTEKPSRNLAEVVQQLNEEEGRYKGKQLKDRDLIRSSYVGYPPPGGHLIRQFGGSDKALIENSNFEATTPQVLNMLNGFVEKRIINNKNADFMKQMAQENRETGKIEDIFMSILNRKPTSTEMKLLKKYIDEPNGAKHIAWILMNSHEFIFIR